MHSITHLIREFWFKIHRRGLRETLAYSFEYLSLILRRQTQLATMPYPSISGHSDGGRANLCLGEPVISILMPVHNTPPEILDVAINSVLKQIYPGWELCICDDASDSPSTLFILDKYLGSDPRLKIIRSDENIHIARATNLAAEYSTGDFVGFLDHDDLLAPEALLRMAEAILANRNADVIYSDEDKIENDGRLSEPHLKPDWSPEHLLSTPYILHFMIVRKSLFFGIGGLRHEYTGAQDYDLSLRATAAARHVVHVPHVLYHWRKLEGSAAARLDAKPQALQNARAAIEDFALSQDKGARVLPGAMAGTFRVCWTLPHDRRVTLLMFTDSRKRKLEDGREIFLVQNAVESIYERSSFRNFNLIVFDNGAMPAIVRDRLENLGAVIELYRQPDGPFNFADKANAGLALVRTEDVVLLNDDIEVISSDWLEALLEQSGRRGVGIVGAQLLYSSGRIQHAGIVLGVNGPSAHIFSNQLCDISYFGYASVVRNYSAVTGAVMATKMSIVRALNGFDRQFSIDYNDVDFCLRAIHAGWRVVYTPFAILHHFEGATLKREAVSETDGAAFVQRWNFRVLNDPFYNPSLPRDRIDCWLSSW